MAPKTVKWLPNKRYEWAVSCLKEAGLQSTRPRQFILRALANHHMPVPLDVLGDELRQECDLATIYRTMYALQKLEIVRQVNLQKHHASFVLVTPGEHCDYLVCDRCGSVSDLLAECPMAELEEQLAAHSGFKSSWHEVVFHGTCQRCWKGNPNQP